jgi:hypothetical protein
MNPETRDKLKDLTLNENIIFKRAIKKGWKNME